MTTARLRRAPGCTSKRICGSLTSCVSFASIAVICSPGSRRIFMHAARFGRNHVGANSGLEHRGRDRVAHHGIPEQICVREIPRGVLPAVGALERAHPLGGFFVFDRARPAK